MNIAIVASYNENKWSSHHGFINAFKQLGHTPHIFSIAKDRACLDLLLDEKDKMDLVIVFAHGQLYDKRLEHTNFKCPVFAEMGDDPQQYANNIKCATLYDILLTPDLRKIISYKREGWDRTFWWTHCFDENVFSPNNGIDQTMDVVTGMYEYGRRVEFLDILKKQKDFTFSNKTTKDGNEYRNHLCSGKIVFNCSNYNEITRRIFEAMACRQFVLTDYIPETTGIYQQFSAGIHFNIYRNKDDLFDKIKYYLKNEQERMIIANNGYEMVQQHSSLERVKQLLTLYSNLTMG